MKKSVVILCCIWLSAVVNAQSRQIKIYLEQIAANKVYIDHLQKGYNIAKQGLTFIGQLRDSHFRLDKHFFDALSAVNPKIKHYSRVADIFSYGIRITGEWKDLKRMIASEPLLNDKEMNYLNNVFSSMSDGCASLIDEVILLVSPAELKLTDDERIDRIDCAYRDMEDRYSFTMTFTSEAKLLLLQRRKEQNDIHTMRKITGINEK